MPAAPCFFAASRVPEGTGDVSQPAYASTCRIAAGDVGRKYRKSISESFPSTCFSIAVLPLDQEIAPEKIQHPLMVLSVND
jgi:hypothetical protein